MVSIKGDDFDFGEGLTPAAEDRANTVIAKIAKLLNGKRRGNEHEKRHLDHRG